MFHEWQTYSTVSRSVEDRCLKGARHNSHNGTENFVVSPITLISVRLRSREDVVWSYMRSWNAQRNNPTINGSTKISPRKYRAVVGSRLRRHSRWHGKNQL
uniref:(northern house mosquito) hypothetical protein n=1 Tax=Culex pipiens TaxID=7175 RepID=A0A8D8A2N3_CULPI